MKSQPPINSIFKTKDKNNYPSQLIYQGHCCCGSNYDGETKKNLKICMANMRTQ